MAENLESIMSGYIWGIPVNVQLCRKLEEHNRERRPTWI